MQYSFHHHIAFLQYCNTLSSSPKPKPALSSIVDYTMNRPSHSFTPRSQDEIEDTPVAEEVGESTLESVAKSFHKTISEDRTDQEALEAHRLVALQDQSELVTEFSSAESYSTQFYSYEGPTTLSQAEDQRKTVDQAVEKGSKRASIAKFDQQLPKSLISQ